jgi:hypothetical protein
VYFNARGKRRSLRRCLTVNLPAGRPLTVYRRRSRLVSVPAHAIREGDRTPASSDNPVVPNTGLSEGCLRVRSPSASSDNPVPPCSLSHTGLRGACRPVQRQPDDTWAVWAETATRSGRISMPLARARRRHETARHKTRPVSRLDRAVTSHAVWCLVSTRV